jgi:RNA polymerase sigma-70 factor (ECF subfamily)
LVHLLSDKALIRRVRNREVDAFQVLYSRYETRIFTFILRYTGSRALAEDLLQETFWRVWQAASTFQPEKGEFHSWLYRVALNAVRSEMAHKRHRLEETGADPSAENTTGRAACQEHSPLGRLERRESQTLFAKALSELSPAMREVVVLKCVEEMKFSEIASVTGTSEGTLKSRFHRAVGELRRRLLAVGR